MATWLDDTIIALKNLGGKAHLNDIFKEVKRIRKTLSPSWTRTIQKELERHSSDSKLPIIAAEASQLGIKVGISPEFLPKETSKLLDSIEKFVKAVQKRGI